MDQMTQFKYYLYLDKFGTWNGRYLILEKKKVEPTQAKTILLAENNSKKNYGN